MVGFRRSSATDEKGNDKDTDNHHDGYKYVSPFFSSAGFPECVLRTTVTAMNSMRANQRSAVRKGVK